MEINIIRALEFFKMKVEDKLNIFNINSLLVPKNITRDKYVKELVKRKIIEKHDKTLYRIVLDLNEINRLIDDYYDRKDCIEKTRLDVSELETSNPIECHIKYFDPDDIMPETSQDTIPDNIDDFFRLLEEIDEDEPSKQEKEKKAREIKKRLKADFKKNEKIMLVINAMNTLLENKKSFSYKDVLEKTGLDEDCFLEIMTYLEENGMISFYKRRIVVDIDDETVKYLKKEFEV